jgi:hypothetical protein
MHQLSNNLGFYPLEPETIVESIVFKKSSLGNSAHILVLTEKRIILQKKRWFRHTQKSLPLTTLTEVQISRNPGLFKGFIWLLISILTSINLYSLWEENIYGLIFCVIILFSGLILMLDRIVPGIRSEITFKNHRSKIKFELMGKSSICALKNFLQKTSGFKKSLNKIFI